MSALGDLAILVAAFAVGTLVALVAGADELGIAFGVGQVGFILAIVFVLLRRGSAQADPKPRRPEVPPTKRRRG